MQKVQENIHSVSRAHKKGAQATRGGVGADFDEKNGCIILVHCLMTCDTLFP